MDSGSPSPFSNLADLNARGSDEGPFEEVPLSTLSQGRWDTGRYAEVEKPLATEKDMESVVDGVIPNAVTLTDHKVAADKQRFNTLGYQKKPKNSAVPKFATVSKGGSGKIQVPLFVMFSQGLSEKAPTPEERAQLDSLKQTLESYPLPALPDWKGGGGGEGGTVTDVTLEESWTDIVHSHSAMNKTQRHQQEALWELIHTELNYIRKLTIVNDLVIAALVNLQKNGFLSEVTPELLFSNLPSILQAHCLFWQEVILPMLKEVRETGMPFDPIKLENGCLQFSERFAAYLQYCCEEERIMDFTRKQSSNPQFQIYMEWVESCPLVGRMRLGDMQAKPHQRITKYPLLLKAILKTTQDPVAQYSVRRMLTNVNSFLDRINEYLIFKDDELALAESAQRVEGYEVGEMMNEEIEKHIKEFCSFDLTCPIRGVGPGDIRKQLSQETLKIREKKDNKVEVVVLLFSDVLLVTKAQREKKKSDKLKVVRPPLALERTRCAALKDGCSFLLVEMSELGCAVNVYTIFTPSSESCSTWVSSILKAQESLAAKREREMSHRLGGFSQIGMQIERLSEIERMMEEREDQVSQSEVEPGLTLEQNPKKEDGKIQYANGTLPLTEEEKNPQNQLKNLNSLFVGRKNPSSQSARGNFAMGQSKGQNSQSGMTDMLMSKSEAKEDNGSAQIDLTENLHPSLERKVTWNHATAKSNKHIILPTVSTQSQSNASHSPLPGKRQNPEITHSESVPSLALSRGGEFNRHTLAGESTSKETQLQGKFSRRASEGQSPRRDISYSQSGDDSWRFSRNFNSPRLRRRRPVGAQHSPFLPVFKNGSLDLEDTAFLFSGYPSSNSEDDYTQNLPRTAYQPAQKSHSYLGLDLRYLRGTQAGLWNGTAQRGSPEPGTTSELELLMRMPEQSSQKRPKFKSQRSVSNPNIIIQAGSLEENNSQFSQPWGGAQRRTSLRDFLDRAQERSKEREREGTMARGKKNLFLAITPSASQSTSPNEADVDFVPAHAPIDVFESGAEKEKEEASDEERKHSTTFPFPDTASVDWAGWCLDEDEVMVFLVPGNGGDGGGQVVAGDRESRMLTLSDLQRINQQEDGECSEV